MKNQFIGLFKEAGLNQDETDYYLEDCESALQLGYKNPFEYYLNSETQYCVIEYAREEWKEIARSGLNKILNIINC